MDPGEMLRSGSKRLGFPLANSTIDTLLIYLEELQAWNRRINLTALNDPKRIVVYHFLDSLSSLAVLDRKPGLTLADLGSGAGFPGMVLQIACPELNVTLVESSEKKAAFLHHLKGKLGVSPVRIEKTRMEDLTERFDRVISRAIAPAELLAIADRLLNSGGELVLFSKGEGRQALISKIVPPWLLLRERAVSLPFVADRRRLFTVGVQS